MIKALPNKPRFNGMIHAVIQLIIYNLPFSFTNIIWVLIKFQLRHLLVVESEYKTHLFADVHN